MAALASSAVALYPTTGGADFYPAGKGDKALVMKRLKLTLTGQGSATNTIGAAALGFDQLVWASALWDAQNSKGYPATIDPVNNVIILLSGADPQAPVDVTSTGGYITVVGSPAIPTA